MQLKRYQERVIREVRSFLDVLAEEQKDGNRHASLDAWDKAKKLFFVPGEYAPRKNGLGRDLPTFCIKVPTGGGKTLLATQILGAVYQTILKDRNGAGLVLWVVPSDQIYKDTLKALRDRRHFYRESLEFTLSRRIEVWEKQEIARLTPAQLPVISRKWAQRFRGRSSARTSRTSSSGSRCWTKVIPRRRTGRTRCARCWLPIVSEG